MAGGVDRLADVGDRRATPVEVSLWTTQTALISFVRVLRRLASIGCGSAPCASRLVDELQALEAEALGHLLPQRGELAGLEHQHAVAGRQRVDERRFPGAGAGSGVDDHRIAWS